MLDQRTTSNYMILVELWIGHSLSVFAPSRVANVKSAPLVSVLYGLHKVFLPRFQVDAAPLEAHAFDVERKNCDSRSYFQERPTRDNSIAIDPVETGFPGQPERRA